jgi:hypothetical protein
MCRSRRAPPRSWVAAGRGAPSARQGRSRLPPPAWLQRGATSGVMADQRPARRSERQMELRPHLRWRRSAGCLIRRRRPSFCVPTGLPRPVSLVDCPAGRALTTRTVPCAGRASRAGGVPRVVGRRPDRTRRPDRPDHRGSRCGTCCYLHRLSEASGGSPGRPSSIGYSRDLASGKVLPGMQGTDVRDGRCDRRTIAPTGVARPGGVGVLHDRRRKPRRGDRRAPARATWGRTRCGGSPRHVTGRPTRDPLVHSRS